MNYEEFLNEAKETLTSLLSEDYPGISITTVDVEKMQNGSYRGLSVREEGKDVDQFGNDLLVDADGVVLDIHPG